MFKAQKVGACIKYLFLMLFVFILRVVTNPFGGGCYVGTVEASLNLTNPLGYAEQVSVGLEYGTQRTNLCSFTYTVPKPWNYPVIGDLRLQQLLTDRQPWSSYVERLRGGMVTVTR